VGDERLGIGSKVRSVQRVVLRVPPFSRSSLPPPATRRPSSVSATIH